MNIFDSVINEQILLLDIFLRLGLAAFSGLIVAGLYRLYHGRESSSTDMIHSLIFLSIIICIAMMVIGNNLASAFGLVGAVSIIRFRTSIKSVRDMSFVFFTIVAGMSCGLGFIRLSLIGLCFTSLTMLVIYFLSKKKREEDFISSEIKISFIGSADEREHIEKALMLYCCSIDLKIFKLDGEKVSYSYRIVAKNENSFNLILSELKENPRLDKLKVMITAGETQ